MKRILDAIITATNLAYMVRDGEDYGRLRDAADKSIRKLDKALDAISDMRKGTNGRV